MWAHGFLVVKNFAFVKTGWICGINYGQKTTNDVELKYRQQMSFSNLANQREIYYCRVSKYPLQGDTVFFKLYIHS